MIQVIEQAGSIEKLLRFIIAGELDETNEFALIAIILDY